MGSAAYRRGSMSIRRQIEDEQRTKGIFTNPWVEENRKLQEEIASLKKQLEHADIAYKLRVAERDVAREECAKAQTIIQEWTDKAREFEKKWLKCSAILNLIRQYVGREQMDAYHAEAKHDYPHLWPDIERDHLGWPK